MPKKRQQGTTRLSRRNALDTLNELVRVLNPVLTGDMQIRSVRTPGDLFGLRQKVKMLSPIEEGGPRSEVQIQRVEVIPDSVIQTLSGIATNAWRARKKMVEDESGEAKDEMKRVYRHIQAILDDLKGVGVEIRDPQGNLYDSGMPLKVISFEPTLGLSREEIIETLKPTVIWQGRLVQIGEVIVGTPEKIAESERETEHV